MKITETSGDIQLRERVITNIDQLNFYGLGGCEDEFRKRYRFRKDTVHILCNLLGDKIGPKSMANHDFTTEQRLCIALKSYPTGTFQREIGDA